MSKLEWNPRKKLHMEFLHTIILELHNEIFQESFEIVRHVQVPEERRQQLRIKIELYKKYSRRLKILEL